MESEEDEMQLVIDLKENVHECLHECSECPKKFGQAANYKTHLKVHGHCDQIYVCPICGKDFLYKNSLAIHIGTHCAAPKQFKCAF